MTTHTKVHTARPGRIVRQLAVSSCALITLAGCAESCPQPQVVVLNNTPPADSGQTVLLTIMIGVAFAAAGAAVVFALLGARQRSKRRDAEEAQRQAEDELLVVRDRARGRARYDLPEGVVAAARTNETCRATAEDLRRPVIERGRS